MAVGRRASGLWDGPGILILSLPFFTLGCAPTVEARSSLFFEIGKEQQLCHPRGIIASFGICNVFMNRGWCGD
jgi:hypothetical protein